MSSSRHSKYLHDLKQQTSSKASTAEALAASYLSSTPGSSYLRSSSTVSRYSSKTGPDFNASLLRRSISGASSTGSPLSASGHRPASKVQRTATDSSSLEHRLAGDEGWRAPPARQLGRSQSAVRGSSFAEHGSASASNSRPSAAVTNAYTASSSRSSSNAAPLQSFFSLPPTRTLRSSTAAGSQPQPYSQPVVANSVLQNGPSQAPRLHAAPSTSRLDQLYAAYKEPAGRLSNSRSASVGRRSSAKAQGAPQVKASSGLPSSIDPQAKATSGRQTLSRQTSSVGSSNYQTSYQSAYSVPSASFKSLSVKHDAHGDRLLPAGQQDLIQAVPSGSGRLSLGALQDQQHSFAVSHCAHPSGKALITAALSKMGFTMRSGKGFVGLVNLGNTCFANSIMQCLVAIPELVAFFLTATAEAGHQQPTGPVSRAFGGLIQQLWQSYSTAVDPYDFMRACGSHEKQWKDGRQHDAQEYLRSILEAMQTELNRVRGRPAYKELKGEGTSGHGLRGGKTCIIQDCLDAFTETETLEEDEGYNCQSCKRKGVCATKKLTLYRCPPVLVLHLKRFSANNNASGIFSRFSAMSKDTTPIEIVADNLDLSPYCSMAARKQARKPVYNLTAVTNHSGSMSGGHYTAQCRSALDNSWYDCNDSSVRPDKFVEGPSSSAYVLFYRLQD
ncbi:hypothetical protein WJX79_004777 [Trebouxia sp. C0005]